MDGLCECGCGERTNLARVTNRAKGWIKGQPLRFIFNHHSRFATPPRRYGKDNHRFNGGLCQRGDGRWIINCRDGSLMMFYRGVMAAHIGRLLTPKEIVHHKNEDPSDDRLENLEVVTRAQHIDMHRDDLMAGRCAT